MNTRKPNDPTTLPPTLKQHYVPKSGSPSQLRMSSRKVQKKKHSFIGRILRIATSVFGGILTLGTISITILYFINPTDMILDQLKAKIKNEIDRDLVVSGPSSLSFFPSLGLKLKNVSLSGPPGFSGNPLISIEGLGINVELIPLFKKKLVIDHIVLTDPKIYFEVDKTGLNTWDFRKKISPEKALDAATPVEEALQNRKLAPSSFDKGISSSPFSQRLELLSFGDIQVEHGTFYYADERDETKEIVNDVNLKLGLRNLSSLAEISGNMTWRREKLEIASTLDSLKNVLANEPAQLDLHISGRPFSASFEGVFNSQPTEETKGNFKIQVSSLSSLLSLAQAQNLPEHNNDSCAISGKLIAFNKTYALNGATLSCLSSQGSGEISVKTGNIRPQIKARLEFSKLDLSPLSATGPAADAGAFPKNKDETGNDPSKSQSQLKVRSQNPPYNETKKRGWSEDPYDYRVLELADLEASLSLQEGLFKDIKFGKSLLLISLKNSMLSAKLSAQEMYEGTAKADLSLNASDPKTPEMMANLEISNIQLLSFLKNAAHMDWLTGKGGLLINVKGRGSNQRSLVESISGTTNLKVHDGAIVGINIAGLFRNADKGLLTGLKSTPSEKTDFSELSSNWLISGGVAHNEDLLLLSPLLRVSGSGNVLLADQTFDYVLRPKVVADLTGQGGNQALAGLQIPVRVHGPWDKPKFSPDIKGILKDPNKTVETIKEIGKQFKGKNAADILNSLFGKGSSSQQQQNPNPDPNSASTNPPN